MNATELLAFGKQHVARGLSRLKEDIIVSGEGSWVTLADGTRAIDFSCGIGVTNLGHCHPKVSKAAADQCMKLVHGQCSIAYHVPYLQLIEKLLPVMPDPSLDTFFFWNSGTEAVEQSIKIARTTTKRQNIIAMQGGYHGRTIGSLSLTRSKTIYGEGASPVMPGTFVTAFPYWHQLGVPPETPEATLVSLALHQLGLLFAQQTAPAETAAIIIEPVLGEGGYIPAPTSFLSALRATCDEHGIVLIFDEVQSGFGRCGKYFACEWSGVKPDVMVFAKGLANGFPLSGVVSSKGRMDMMPPGTMGGTYAGNAVSCAAAIACTEVMKEENILQNVIARSVELLSFLQDMQEIPEFCIVDVRGQGLMVAIEFACDDGRQPAFKSQSSKGKLPPRGIASKVSKLCAERGLLLLSTSVFEVIRFIPPLNISSKELATGLAIFKQAIEDLVNCGW